jgi:hypothetical protein
VKTPKPRQRRQQSPLSDVKAYPQYSIGAFHEWPMSLPPGQFVGSTGDACRCPLANYLKIVGVKEPCVLASQISAESLQGIHRTSEVARNFVSEVTNLILKSQFAITADKASAILERSWNLYGPR